MRVRTTIAMVIIAAGIMHLAGCSRDTPESTTATPPRADVSASPAETPAPPPRLTLTTDAMIYNARQFSDLSEFDEFIADPDSIEMTDETGRTLLHLVAANSGRRVDTLAAQALADAGERPTSVSDLPMLDHAPTLEMARKLIDLGADISARDNVGNTPLHAAAGEGDRGLCELLQEHGADVNARNARQQTPLHLLAKRGTVDTGRVLLAAGADADARDEGGRTPSQVAAANGCTKLVELLGEHARDVDAADAEGQTALHRAAAAGSLRTVKTLLDAGADMEARADKGRTPLHEAAAKARIEVIEFLVSRGASVTTRDGDGRSALSLLGAGGDAQTLALLDPGDGKYPDAQEQLVKAAGREGSVGEVRFWLGKGADPNAASGSGRLPIHEAAHWAPDPEVLRVLARAGADLNARSRRGAGRTPLETSIHESNPAAFALLIQLGADVTAADARGRTALHYAAAANYADLCEKLLNSGAQVDARTKDSKQTPLHLAAEAGRLHAARMLLAQGADVNAKDADGRTPLKLAQKHPEVIELLAESGAKAVK